MKKLLLIVLALVSSTALAYKINIQNDTEFELKVTPQFAAAIKKYEWVIKPGEKFFNETHAYCTKSLKIAATKDTQPVVSSNPQELPVVEYKPKSTGAGIRCADFKIVVKTIHGTGGKILEVINPDEKIAVKK